MAVALGFSNARLPALNPLINSGTFDEAEAALQQLFIDLFDEHIAPDMFDVNVVANPQLGSIGLIRRSIDDMGLSLLNEIINDNEARLLHKAWRGNHKQGRGFFMFETILQVMYHGNYAIEQYWHPKATALLSYPADRFLASVTPPTADDFLTSRVYIRIPGSASDAELAILRKIALSVLPARIVAFIESVAPAELILDCHDSIPPPPEIIIAESDSSSTYTDIFDLGNSQ